jgi:hypothetical protein
MISAVCSRCCNHYRLGKVQKRQQNANMSYYTLYRKASIGTSLLSALNELVDTNRISAELKDDIVQQFDESISTVLTDKLNNSITFKGHCKVFKQPEPAVRNFYLENTKFKIDGTEINVDYVNIVACEAQNKEKGAPLKGTDKNKKKKLAPAKGKKRKTM